MASAFFYGLCRWVFDDAAQTWKMSVSMEVTEASGAEFSQHATEDKPQAELDDPAIWYTEFPNSNNYAVMLAGTCPTLPPASADIFCFCTRTYGGQSQVCDFDLPAGGAWKAALVDYLNFWFPSLAPVAQALGPQTTRVGFLNALAQVIQPGVAAVTSEFPGS